MLEEEILERLRRALESPEYWLSVASALRRDAGPPDSDPIWPFIWAFEYELVAFDREDRRAQWGPFAPMIEFEQGVFPPPLPSVDPTVLESWEHAAEAIEDNVARSRLRDLLWVAKSGDRPDLHARNAISAYVRLAGSNWSSSITRAECLVRALEITREMNDSAEKLRVTRAIEEAARSSMGQTDPEPGVALKLIRGLMRASASEESNQIDALLEEAAAVYADDPWISETVDDLRAERAKGNQERVKDLKVRQIQRWREQAAKGNGLLRLMHLQHALELARVNGLRDLAEEIRREIQGISPEDLKLKTISSKIEIPSEEVDKFLDYFASGRDWAECLERFGSHGPPSGDHTKNLAAVEEKRANFPLQFLFSKVVLGPGGVPVRIVQSDVNHLEVALVEHETYGIEIWGTFAKDALLRIQDKHGPPVHEELTELFTTPLIAREVSERFAQSLLLYLAGNVDESVHILLPRIETVIRELCRTAGLAVIREPVDSRPGGVRGLGELLWDLKGLLDESWRRYLWNLLAEPMGVNLRNRVLHGLISIPTDSEGALALHAACFLRLLMVTQGPQLPEPPKAENGRSGADETPGISP